MKDYDGRRASGTASRREGRSDRKAKYVLSDLYGQRKFTAETVALLHKREAVAPNASLALAATLAARGEREQVRAEAEKLLVSHCAN